ncbi:peptidoglycan-binding protein [Clostridia bacterium]|nr:peptidoglycan-binding protein [Clostridia bacterium]
MRDSLYAYALENNVDTGKLKVFATSAADNRPVPDATISVSLVDDPTDILDQLNTNSSGQTEPIDLPAPPIEYSLEKDNNNQPYSNYTITIEAPGYEPCVISGAEILSGELSLQNVSLLPLDQKDTFSEELINIPDHRLYGNYPPKIAEPEVKPVPESGEIVLSRVVVPQTVIVHDGVPTDSSAKDYYEPYRDYVKNVASSEIYSTWTDATIRANVYAIMSFTLNRVYTEWYRGKGYDFTITSSTAFDHKWIYGRNIYEKISLIVDEIFDSYLSRPEVKQPILTQYCDGRQVTCPNWMTQWGSQELGEQGFSAMQIINHFYGSDMYLNHAEQISGIPSSWPGYNLTVGSTGDKVKQMQNQLARISQAYSAITTLIPDGIFGPLTAQAVRDFQKVFDLPVTGVVDFRTWYKISHIYVGVTRIAELN